MVRLVLVIQLNEHLMLYFFCVCVADVPDAPKHLELSELKSPWNVHLSWVPGSDHNSSVTGRSSRTSEV